MREIKGVAPGGGGGSSSEGGALWGVLFLAAAAILLIAAGVGYAGGSTVYRATLDPLPAADDVDPRTLYMTAPISLKPGKYNVHLRFRNFGGGLFRSSISYGVASKQLPGWDTSGSFTERRRSDRDRRRNRRRSASDSFVLPVFKETEAVLDLTFSERTGKSLEVRVQRAMFDYRLPLVLGVILAGGAIAISPTIRETLGRMLHR